MESRTAMTRRYIVLQVTLPLTYEPEPLGPCPLEERRRETIRLLSRLMERPEDLVDASCWEVEVEE